MFTLSSSPVLPHGIRHHCQLTEPESHSPAIMEIIILMRIMITRLFILRTQCRLFCTPFSALYHPQQCPRDTYYQKRSANHRSPLYSRHIQNDKSASSTPGPSLIWGRSLSLFGRLEKFGVYIVNIIVTVGMEVATAIDLPWMGV